MDRSDRDRSAAVDVAIVGGGIVGACVAYFLATAPQRPDSIIVLEPDPAYERSATTRSAAAIRQQFNLAVNVAMARFGYEFFTHADELLRVDGADAVDLAFAERGYVVLAGPKGVERLAAAHARQRAAGAEIAFLTVDELVRRLPWLKPEGVGAGCLGLRGEGWFDPRAALVALRRKAESLGVRYVAARVTGLPLAGDRVAAVELEDGTRVEAETVVDAAGGCAGAVARLAGIAAPVEARKRCAFVFRCASPPVGFTNLVDPTVAGRSLYARPYGDDFLAMTAPPPERDPASTDFEVDVALFEEVLRPALARRVRGFERVELVRAWAGHYDFNTFDQNAILGRYPAVANFVFACGFSGHGVMHAPAAARGIAELLSTGAYRTIDLTPFCFERIAAGEPLDEVQPSEHRSIPAGL
ncbi:MAG: NAD(P)/FAD-dependent oxidoreductase [Ktedonobacterales bacterium]